MRNKNRNLFEANYDRRWWGTTRMGLAKEKIICFYNNWSKVRRDQKNIKSIIPEARYEKNGRM